MKLNYNYINTSVMPNFNGGEKEFRANIYNDGLNKIITRGVLIPGASIGLHTHTESSEIIYVLEGIGTMVCNGVEEVLLPGDIHYCPKGSSHTFINKNDCDLVFFAIVPNQ